MTPAVVDTNVPVAASGRSSHVSKGCVLACAKRLDEVMEGGQVVIDSEWRILREYMGKLNQSGQPAIGDRFLKFILTHMTNPNRCTRVDITPIEEDGPEDYEEFPRDPGLASFDASDRKFVAVAVAHGGSPPILQASDSDYWAAREALRRNGIVVEFLCEDEVSQG